MPATSNLQNTRFRVPQLDVARSFALLAMAIYHFNFDLAMFGLIAPETLYGTPLWLLARVTASSFLMLVGISLFLAHGRGIRWPAFLRRLGVLIAAAALVSVGTSYAVGDAWVRFGILHSIAASSVIGLVFLRLPAVLTLACAVACFFAPQIIGPDAISSPWLLWLLPVSGRPPMVDYLPLLPWLTPVLVGIGGARLAEQAGLWTRLSRPADAPGSPAWLTWPGRHSLAVYLIHQPVLIFLVWAYVQLGG